MFAAELDRSGRRQFIVCHWEKMWSVIQELRPDREVFLAYYCLRFQTLLAKFDTYSTFYVLVSE